MKYHEQSPAVVLSRKELLIEERKKHVSGVLPMAWYDKAYHRALACRLVGAGCLKSVRAFVCLAAAMVRDAAELDELALVSLAGLVCLSLVETKTF